MNKPWLTPEGKKIWKTEASYWSWLRGALRRIWSDYPLRKEWKARQLRPVTKEEKEDKKYHPSTKNVGQCHYCNEWFAGSKLECDHTVSSDGCTSKETAESFLWYCGGGIGVEWVLSCKPCHSIKTLSERQGISFEEARVLQKAILLEKTKQDKQYLIDHNITPASNKEGRREQLIKLISEENEHD